MNLANDFLNIGLVNYSSKNNFNLKELQNAIKNKDQDVIKKYATTTSANTGVTAPSTTEFYKKYGDLTKQRAGAQKKLESKTFWEKVGDALIDPFAFDLYTGGDTGKLQKQLHDLDKQLTDMQYSDERLKEQYKTDEEARKQQYQTSVEAALEAQNASANSSDNTGVIEPSNSEVKEITKEEYDSKKADLKKQEEFIYKHTPMIDADTQTELNNIASLLYDLENQYYAQEQSKQRAQYESAANNADFIGTVQKAENGGINWDDGKDSALKDKIRYLADLDYRAEIDRKDRDFVGYLLNDKYHELEYVTYPQKLILEYYAAKGDWDNAKAYYDTIKRGLNAESQAAESKLVQDFANKHKIIGGVMNIGSSLLAPAAYVATGVQSISNNLTGDYTPVDENSIWFKGAHEVQDTEIGITRNMNETQKLITDTALGLGQFALTIPLGGTGSLVVMSSSAAGQTALQALQNGATTDQAFALSTVAGTVQYLTNKIPVGRFFNLLDGGKEALEQGLKSVAIKALADSGKQAVLGVAQEAVSQYANILSDNLIMGDKSQYNRLVEQYISDGKSREQAERDAFNKVYIQDVITAAGASAVSSGILGGLASIKGGIKVSKVNAATPDTPTITWQDAIGEMPSVAPLLQEQSAIAVSRDYPARVNNAEYKIVEIPQEKIDEISAYINRLSSAEARIKYKYILKNLFMGQTFTNKNTVINELKYKIGISSKGIGEIIARQPVNAQTLAVLEKLNEVVENAKYIASEPTNKDTRDIQRTDRFETATLAGNQPGVAKIRVNVTPQGNKLYYATNELTGAATPQPRDSQGYPRGIEAATPATNINIPQNVRKVNAAGDSHPASVESIRQTYEKLIAEQQAANAENLAAANRVRDLTDVYRENVQTKGAGADTVSAQQVENSAGQGYNGIDTLEKLYDEAVHSKGTEGAGDAPTKPYTTSRPKYGKTQVDDVWNNYKDPTTGKAPDPAGGSISWDKTKPRQGQWDMGHIPEEKYSDMRDRYIRGEISQQEFLGWYRNPANYRPELPSTNRSHKYE